MFLIEKKIIPTLLLLTFCFSAWAQVDSLKFFIQQPIYQLGSTNSTSVNKTFKPESDFKLKFSGSHYFQYHLPVSKKHNNYNTLIKAPKWINEIGFKINNKNIELVSKWEIRSALEESGDWQTQSELRIKENYLKIEQGDLSFSFGFQDYSWGVADEFNPTNNLNPKDYEIKGFEMEDIPILSASVKYYPSEKWSFQGVFIPFEQSDVYFWDYKDFIPAELFFRHKVSANNFDPDNIVLSPIALEKNINYKHPDFSPQSSIVAVKASFYSSGLDFSLSYIYDIDPFYTPEISIENYAVEITDEVRDHVNTNYSPDEADEILNELSGLNNYRVSNVELKRKRIHRLGFDAKTIIGKYGIWLEACYSIYADTDKSYKRRNNELSFVSGIDFFYGPNDRFYANLQYTGRWVIDFNNSFFTDYENGLPNAEQTNKASYMEEYYHRMLVQPFGMQTEKYTHGFVVSLDFDFFNGILKPTFNAYYTLPSGYDKEEKKRYGSLLLIPEIDYSPGNSLHFYLGTNLAYAWYKARGSHTVRSDDQTDLIGFLNPYNNIYLKIAYKWNHTIKR